MTDTINDQKEKTKTNDWMDSPEPDQDFNNTVAEVKLDQKAAIYTRQRPKDDDYFRVYDPSETGDFSKVPRRVIVRMPVKGKSRPFLCLGNQEFYKKVKNDFSKVEIVRLAMYETANGRIDVWPIKEAKENRNGTINSYNLTANSTAERALTKWTRCSNNDDLGYYDHFGCNDEKEATLAEQGRPFFKEPYKEVCKKAFQDFILTPDNYDNDPHVKDFVGFRVQSIIQNEKGKKIN
jgi:hypothetical protein|tara:strand:- start:3641 stop:4348 length:708 start_codon:yes stop_codon:yes gene_type:complete